VRRQTGNGAKLSLFGGANKACVAGGQKGLIFRFRRFFFVTFFFRKKKVKKAIAKYFVSLFPNIFVTNNIGKT